jgi:glutamine synthetase
MMHESIPSLCTQLADAFALLPVMAAEIECYVMLPDTLPEMMEHFFVPVDAALRAAGVPLLRIEKERGLHQFEIITAITTPEILLQSLVTIRTMIEARARELGVAVSFAAKPFPDQPSSGLHLHLHLSDAEGLNVYHKTEDWTSDCLRFSLGGLLADLPQAMPIFFPNAQDYARLDDPDHVPKIAGWGVNNRYCALRIPMEPDLYHKRIEHRVPCANANPERAIAAMLRGVLLGLRDRIEPPAQEYGKVSGNGMLRLLSHPLSSL